MANFAANFSGLFFQDFSPPPPQNSRPEIVGISLQFDFLEPNFFLHADFLLTWETNT